MEHALHEIRTRFKTLQADNARLVELNAKLIEALKEIAKGEGAFSLDQLEHCFNTVESMKEIAQVAIKEATQEV